MGEAQVVVPAVAHPGRQGVAFALELAAAGGVEGEPGGGRVAEPAAALSRTSASMARCPAARAASEACFSSSSASIACRAQITSSAVPVSVTAVSSQSR
jgi:hypothetical protein